VQSSEDDRKVIETLGTALLGSNRPLVISSGTGLARSMTGNPVIETDGYIPSSEFPRGASEEAADAIAAQGGRVMVVRLSQVHDRSHQGRIAQHIQLARQKGWVAYVGAGDNRVPAVHVTDAAILFRLALEQGRAGARYHGVAEEGIVLRDIVDVIGTGLGIPVKSISADEATEYFGWMAPLAMADVAASSALTREQLSWTPHGPDFLHDLSVADYRAL
jgi:nucleoside-diphosphate-sugar epimerase